MKAMTMRLTPILLASAFALTAAAPLPLTEEQAAGGQWKQDDIHAPVQSAAQAHIDAAKKAAGDQFVDALRLCNSSLPEGFKLSLPNANGGRYGSPAPEPIKAFDNLYLLRAANVTAWAIDTDDGIFVLDTLNNGKEAEALIAGGLRKFGLDPARIRYVLVSHGHGDHYGGAAYLQKQYGARIMMSAKDWKLSPKTLDKPYFEPAPPRDLTVKDGDRLKLGSTTIRFVATPGHTLGTTSVLIPVTDRGVRHMVMIWSGTGYNFPHSPQRFGTYANSARRMKALALKYGADVAMGNHNTYDLNRLAARLAARGPGDPNPFVVGKDGVARFLDTFSHCALAFGAQMQNPPPIIPPAAAKEGQ